MSDLYINLLSALAVSLIISSMSQVKNQKLKSILYVLPIPITVALIGSHSIATSLSISGLLLTTGFLWGCYFLNNRLKVNVLVADVILSVLYIAIAYGLVHILKVEFWQMLLIFTGLWLVLMAIFKKLTFKHREGDRSKTNPYLKALIIFVIAFGLFSAHQYLAAFVVTFPYNGVFAVYENRHGLLPQAALFTRNSLALAAYFTANYLVGTQQSDVMRYFWSWVAFGMTLLIISKLVEIKTKSIKVR